MNPFSRGSSYDSTLADIVERLGRRPVDIRALRDLFAHLPRADLGADLPAIKMCLKPLFGYGCPQVRRAVNCILCRLVRRLGSADELRDLECEWLYHNFDADDEYARKMRAGSFDVRAVEHEFCRRISWDNPARALACFVYLVENAAGEYAFDTAGLACDSGYVFDQLGRILRIIAARAAHVRSSPTPDPESAFARLYHGLLSRVAGVRTAVLVSRKYDILLNFYGYADSSVYEESRHFTDENCRDLTVAADDAARAVPVEGNLLHSGDLDYDRLHANSVAQIEALLGRVRDREGHLLANIDRRVNLFDLCRRLGLGSAFVTRNKEALMPAINESIMELYRRDRAGADVRGMVARDVLDAVCGTHKIVLARLLGETLAPEGFTKGEIESVFDCSARVFPLEYLTANEFDCSCVPLLEAHRCDAEALLPLYRRTGLEDVVFYMEDVEPLKRLVLGLGEHDALEKYARVRQKIEQQLAGGAAGHPEGVLRTIRLVWHVFCYKLRGRAVEPAVPGGAALWEIDYGLVFEHFFTREFIGFLAAERRNRKGLLQRTIEYLRDARICNTVYFTGYNFDDQRRFYCDVAMPAEDLAVKTLCRVYEGVERSAEETVVLHLLQIAMYREPEIERPDEIAGCVLGHAREGADAEAVLLRRECRPPLFDLGDNSFLFERLLRQLFSRPARITPALLSVGREKALDVLLRRGAVGWRHAAGANPTFLSPEGLRACVDVLVDRADAQDAELAEYVCGEWEARESCDLVRFMEADDCLLIAYLRAARLEIYERMVVAIAAEISDSLVNSYSLAKLDSASDDATVFELMVAPLVPARRLFWMLLVRSLHHTNNLYISLFIEDFIMRHADGSPGPLDAVGSPTEYLRLCGRQELGRFAFVLPALYRSLRPPGEADIEGLVRAVADRKIEGSRITFSRTPDAYSLTMKYYFDSVPYTAVLRVPCDYPHAHPRLEFDYEKSNCPKFYLKINELLKRSSKFVEIFMQWKVNLDNRFAGHKECLVCYYVLEPKMRTFADFACANCRNKFHKKCIYEWVRTSRNTQCPLCRVEMKIW